MTTKRIFAIGFIIAATSIGWFVLGSALLLRTDQKFASTCSDVAGNWGPPLSQSVPAFYYISPTSAREKRPIETESTNAKVQVNFSPKRKGLLWHRAYTVDFAAEYLVKNPAPIAQTVYAVFPLPATDARYDRFSLAFGEKESRRDPSGNTITEAILLKPNESVTLSVKYRATGLNVWRYSFGNAAKMRNFHLAMETNFREIDIPVGAESPTKREKTADGWKLHWDYSKILGANAIGMAMPAVNNPGPIATRIAFFAPVSLLFFFMVVIIIGMLRGINLHPMNFFFLGAGCFAFQLLFAYTVDIMPLLLAFIIAAVVSLVLVNGYIYSVAGRSFAKITLAAQFAYMVLFSYSFFFRGMTGLAITIGAIITLALLMRLTAKTNWDKIFRAAPKKSPTPPAVPVR